MKRTNKTEQVAESVEVRGPAKENASRPTEPRTQGRADSTDGLRRIRAAASRDADVQFTALLHHVTQDLLEASYFELKRSAASGVDGVTWKGYGEDLRVQLRDLKERVHSGRYRTKPTRRTWIAKEDGRDRPLGIPALEDKIVQKALVTVLNEVYEADFLGFSYGFRPGRSQHDALDALWVGISRTKVNWVLDADIRDYFGTINHDWLTKFIEHRIGDPRVLRLIRKMLKAGVIEETQWSATDAGTPQGAVISPLLANVYLHYVFDLWAHHWRRHHAHGDVIIVRYADDFVVGFERREDAERFREDLQERLAKFDLELHPEKTRLIEFGRRAEGDRKRRGDRRPETFHFLGFTHFCTRTRHGHFTVGRKPMAKRTRRKLKQLRKELRRRMHWSRPRQGAWLGAVFRGWMHYYSVPGSYVWIAKFRDEVEKSWRWTLHRQSQKAASRWTWPRMRRLSLRWIPRARIIHPYPDRRLPVRTQGRSRMG